ncbi:5-oxoprolinase subunit C family protein [Fusibacter ferrireducens]|uniref:Biotin-dependent carboxyltransferase n=1 Tax=Fusibacter ferrireducens TaxID=2785058 RepID=A0ABR9ZWU7_9FIRM|nr:biotin-dependent carboxyltransferase family protein [Fusibacter ferrireducens]MBF4694426.1 biotin-dependent carboxyltransferase [Fusibacter ferrireducens]
MKIIEPGLLTTFQDDGRKGYQQYGVPVAGAMDSFAMQLANILVGNHRNDVVLEITMKGPSIEFTAKTYIALTGGKCPVTLDGNSVNMYETVCVHKGSILKIGQVYEGFRVYLAVRGSFDLPKIMGSASTYLRGRIGGLEGDKLRVGAVLSIKEISKNRYFNLRKMPEEVIPVYDDSIDVKVILGPEDDSFTPEGMKTFLGNEYILTHQCDRMGYRLEGAKIEHREGADIISSGISLGAIQVPSHGEPIIMMADRQPTGGYAKIANVISCDISRLAQLKPGDKVRFSAVRIDEAHQMIKAQEQTLTDLAAYYEKNEIVVSERARIFSIRVKEKQYEVVVEEIK